MITPGFSYSGQPISAISANISASAIQNLTMRFRTTPQFVTTKPRRIQIQNVIQQCQNEKSEIDYPCWCDIQKLVALPFEIGYDVCYVQNTDCYPAKKVYVAPRMKKGVVLLDRYELVCVPTKAEFTEPCTTYRKYKGAPRLGYMHLYGGHVLYGWGASTCEWVSLGERQLVNGEDYPNYDEGSTTGTWLLGSIVWPRFVPTGQKWGTPGSETLNVYVGTKHFIGDSPKIDDDYPKFPNVTELYDNSKPYEMIPLGAYYISVRKQTKCAVFCGKKQKYTELTVSDGGNGIKYWRGNVYGAFFTMDCEIYYESECRQYGEAMFSCKPYHYGRPVSPSCADDGSQYFQLIQIHNTYIPPCSLTDGGDSSKGQGGTIS